MRATAANDHPGRLTLFYLRDRGVDVPWLSAAETRVIADNIGREDLAVRERRWHTIAPALATGFGLAMYLFGATVALGGLMILAISAAS